VGSAAHSWRVAHAGYQLSEATVSRWMRRAPRSPHLAQRWLTFLRNHREAIAAMDFFTVPTLTFGVLYGFFVIAHDRRRILHCNVTRSPEAVWIFLCTSSNGTQGLLVCHRLKSTLRHMCEHHSTVTLLSWELSTQAARRTNTIDDHAPLTPNETPARPDLDVLDGSTMVSVAHIAQTRIFRSHEARSLIGKLDRIEVFRHTSPYPNHYSTDGLAGGYSQLGDAERSWHTSGRVRVDSLAFRETSKSDSI